MVYGDSTKIGAGEPSMNVATEGAGVIKLADRLLGLLGYGGDF